jgi:Zn-dependent peptidase ImmA (M78 family)
MKMITDERWTSLPVQRAREISHKLGLKSYPIDLRQVIESLDISFKEVNIDDHSFDGCAIKEGETMGIMINSSVKYSARKNFTIAHELGHCCIESHLEPIYRCSQRNIESFDPGFIKEREASEFATELLMPESIFHYDACRVPISFRGIIELSEKYGASLTATAIRYIKCSEEKCALLLSNDQGIIWGIKSRNFPFELRKGSLSENSFAIDFFKGTLTSGEPHPVLMSAWSRNEYISPEIDLKEESMPCNSLGMVLTILSIKNESEEDE